MLDSLIIQWLQEKWVGPAITAVVGRKRFTLGYGPPTAAISVASNGLMRDLLCSRSLSVAFARAFISGNLQVLDGDIRDVLCGFYKTLINIAQDSKLVRALKRFRSAVHAPIDMCKARRNSSAHYDAGNQFFSLWLDPSLTYTCAYYPMGTESLVEAQRAKLDLVCRKACLKVGQSVVDVGCGWGSLLFHVAENYDVTITGVVAAREQARHIADQIKARGLQGKVDVVEADWREIGARFDRLFAIGLHEHIGVKQYGKFYEKICSCLTRNGVALVHTIGRRTPASTNAWIAKEVFPHGHVPALGDILCHAGKAGLWIWDVENLRPHYERTCCQWADRFEESWDTMCSLVGEREARKWLLYLRGSEVAFRMGDLELYQVVLTQSPQCPWGWNRSTLFQ